MTALQAAGSTLTLWRRLPTCGKKCEIRLEASLRSGLVGSFVTVKLEIAAEIPSGVSDQAVRTVSENSRTLKFDPDSGFERE